MLSASTVFAQEEPWGGNVPGWSFTQAADPGNVVNCRATQGSSRISLRSNGRSYVSVPPPVGLPKGWYREGRASVVMGGTSEPVDAEIGGSRMLLHIDAGLYPALIRARGYQWRVSGPKGVVTGSVSFSGDVAKVIAELRACVKANSAAAQPRPAPAPAARSGGNLRWSGDWVWIRPLTIFGKPTNTRSLSIELLQGDRVNICYDLSRSSTCKVVPFTQQSGVYLLSYGGTDIFQIQLASGGLVGQYWFDKQNRGRTGPDGTFALR